MKTFNFIGILLLGILLYFQLSPAFGFKPKETYKMTYFDIRGRGEFLRFMFSYAGRPFVDDRVKAEDWPALKPKQPFGQLPVLEIKRGSKVTVIAQSQAIGILKRIRKLIFFSLISIKIFKNFLYKVI